MMQQDPTITWQLSRGACKLINDAFRDKLEVEWHPAQVEWHLPLSQCNAIIGALGEMAFNKVADVLVDLRTQAGQQLQQMQQQAQNSQMPPQQAANGEIMPPAPRPPRGNKEDRPV